MQLISWLTAHQMVINQLWTFTLISTLTLYVACNLLPDRIVGNILPLHNVFRPKKNVDLDFQSIGYAMLHTRWIARITHYTIIFDSVLWFVIFQSWHWSVPFIILSAVLLQSVYIGERRFGIFFVLASMIIYILSTYFIFWLGMANAVLLAKAILMFSGVMRMIGHTVELMPPLLLENSDKFVALKLKNITWKIPVVAVIGCIAEFASGLPNRLLPVQLNFLYQRILGLTPQNTLPWQQVEISAKTALTNGYSALNALKNYYQSVTGE